jgi:hypothetical protein
LVVIDIINLTPGGFISAILAHLSVAGFFGVLMTYLLLYTGKDFWVRTGAFYWAKTNSRDIMMLKTHGRVFHAGKTLEKDKDKTKNFIRRAFPQLQSSLSLSAGS